MIMDQEIVFDMKRNSKILYKLPEIDITLSVRILFYFLLIIIKIIYKYEIKMLYFCFSVSIESIGALNPNDLFVDTILYLKEKCRMYIDDTNKN